MLRRCLTSDVESKCGLSHTRARGKQDKVGFLETGEQVIELRETRRNAAQCRLMLLQMLETVPRFGQLFFYGAEIAKHRSLGDRENSGLCFIQHLFYLTVFFEPQFSYLRRGIDKGAEHVFRLDVLCVMPGASRARCRARELGKVAGAAYFREEFPLLQFSGKGNNIYRLAPPVERKQCVAKGTMLACVKRIDPD